MYCRPTLAKSMALSYATLLVGVGCQSLSADTVGCQMTTNIVGPCGTALSRPEADRKNRNACKNKRAEKSKVCRHKKQMSRYLQKLCCLQHSSAESLHNRSLPSSTQTYTNSGELYTCKIQIFYPVCMTCNT